MVSLQLLSDSGLVGMALVMSHGGCWPEVSYSSFSSGSSQNLCWYGLDTSQLGV